MHHFLVASLVLLAFDAHANGGEKKKVDPFEQSGRRVVEGSGFQYFQFGVVPPLAAWRHVKDLQGRDYTTFHDQLPKVLRAPKRKQFDTAVELLPYFTGGVRTCALERGVKYPRAAIYRALSPHGSLVFVALTRALHSPNLRQRCRAAATILTFDENHELANTVLTEAIKTADIKLRIEICEMIGAASLSNKINMDLLIAAINQKNPKVRYAAANAVWNMGRPAKRAVPALIELLQSSDELERPNPYYNIDYSLGKANVALEALIRMGPDAKPAVPVLMRMLTKAGKYEKSKLIAAIAAIGPGAKSCLPALRKMLKQKKSKAMAAAAMICISPQDKAAVSFLEKELQCKDNTKREIALKACHEIGVSAKILLPIIIGCLEEDEDLRYHAALALANFGADAAIAVPQLERMLTDDNCRAAALALLSIGKSSVPGLIRIINKRSNRGRALAFDVLGRIGKHAQPALNQLTRIAADKNDECRYEALNAICLIAAETPTARAALTELRRQLLTEEQSEMQMFSLLWLEYALSEMCAGN